MTDPDAYLAGYMGKEAKWTDLVTKPVGAVAGSAGEAVKWSSSVVFKLVALLALVPPAIGAAAGLASSNVTSPSAADEESVNALIEEQEVDRMLAETGRLTKAQQGKLKKDKETAGKRGLYLG